MNTPAPEATRTCDPLDLRGQHLPMTPRQALACACLALEHAASCDDEDKSYDEARRMLARWLRRLKKGNGWG